MNGILLFPDLFRVHSSLVILSEYNVYHPCPVLLVCGLAALKVSVCSDAVSSDSEVPRTNARTRGPGLSIPGDSPNHNPTTRIRRLLGKADGKLTGHHHDAHHHDFLDNSIPI